MENQCGRILKYINDFGSITTLEAMVDLGVLRLGARISELRQKGIKISDKWETVRNRYEEKTQIKRYFIEK